MPENGPTGTQNQTAIQRHTLVEAPKMYNPRRRIPDGAQRTVEFEQMTSNLWK